MAFIDLVARVPRRLPLAGRMPAVPGGRGLPCPACCISVRHPSQYPSCLLPPFPEPRVRLSLLATLLLASVTLAEDRPVVRSARSGPWEAADTWAGGKVPAAGDSVLV